MDFGVTPFYNSYWRTQKIEAIRVEYRPGAAIRLPIPSERNIN